MTPQLTAESEALIEWGSEVAIRGNRRSSLALERAIPGTDKIGSVREMLTVACAAIEAAAVAPWREAVYAGVHGLWTAEEWDERTSALLAALPPGTVLTTAPTPVLHGIPLEPGWVLVNVDDVARRLAGRNNPAPLEGFLPEAKRLLGLSETGGTNGK